MVRGRTASPARAEKWREGSLNQVFDSAAARISGDRRGGNCRGPRRRRGNVCRAPHRGGDRSGDEYSRRCLRKQRRSGPRDQHRSDRPEVNGEDAGDSAAEMSFSRGAQVQIRGRLAEPRGHAGDVQPGRNQGLWRNRPEVRWTCYGLGQQTETVFSVEDSPLGQPLFYVKPVRIGTFCGFSKAPNSPTVTLWRP